MPRPRTVSDQEILGAAARVIGRAGPGGITLAEVGEEVGVSPSTLVQRFGSKRKLLLAVAEGAPPALSRRIERARAAEGSSLDALVAMLVTESAGFGAAPQAAANHLAFLQIDLEDDEFRRHAVEHSERMEEGIRDLLREAVERGELEECDTERLARSLLVAYSGALITWAIRRRRPLEEALSRDLRSVLAPHVTS